MRRNLLKYALERVEEGGTKLGSNLIAYSGGVDSSLVAALVKRVYPANSFACIGLSASLPQSQLELARNVANHIGIPLKEIMTDEAKNPEYISNRGMSCFHCKTHLYTALQAVVMEAQTMKSPVTLFNGTNADDKKDSTRVGLKAARDFQVRSPIDHLTKAEVRALAKELDLPNWQHAASPCLRSRLALGVPAIQEHLQRVETAENIVRHHVALQVHHNMRVRMLAANTAAIELDGDIMEEAVSQLALIDKALEGLGFSAVTLRPFRSGSVSGGGGLYGKKQQQQQQQQEEVVRVDRGLGRRGREGGLVAGAEEPLADDESFRVVVAKQGSSR